VMVAPWKRASSETAAAGVASRALTRRTTSRAIEILAVAFMRPSEVKAMSEE
jgi:hypothetical protein